MRGAWTLVCSCFPPAFFMYFMSSCFPVKTWWFPLKNSLAQKAVENIRRLLRCLIQKIGSLSQADGEQAGREVLLEMVRRSRQMHLRPVVFFQLNGEDFLLQLRPFGRDDGRQPQLELAVDLAFCIDVDF